MNTKLSATAGSTFEKLPTLLWVARGHHGPPALVLQDYLEVENVDDPIIVGSYNIIGSILAGVGGL